MNENDEIYAQGKWAHTGLPKARLELGTPPQLSLLLGFDLLTSDVV